MATLNLTDVVSAWVDQAAPNTVEGTAEVLRVVGGESGIRRAFVSLDLSSIPSGATIDAGSKFWIFRNTAFGASSQTKVGRLAAAWTPGEVTYNSRAAGVPWTVAGGDLAGQAEQTLTGNGAAYESCSIADIVAAAIAAGDSALNLYVRANDEGEAFSEVEQEFQQAAATNPPYIELVYTPAQPSARADQSGDADGDSDSDGRCNHVR